MNQNVERGFSLIRSSVQANRDSVWFVQRESYRLGYRVSRVWYNTIAIAVHYSLCCKKTNSNLINNSTRYCFSTLNKNLIFAV